MHYTTLASLTLVALSQLSQAVVIIPRSNDVGVSTTASSTICACISGSITVANKDCGSIAVSDELCTCVSILADTVSKCKLSPIKTALSIASSAQVVLSLTDKIKTQPTQATCTHPDNSTPVCTSVDLCGFTCNDGYSKVGNTCVSNTPTTDVSTVSTVCGCISGTFNVRGKNCGSFAASDGLCTCISILDTFVASTTLSPIKVALGIASSVDVIAALTSTINTSTGPKSVCTHPSNSSPSCSSNDICGFTCKSGFTKSGNSCVPTPPPATSVTVSSTVCACVSGAFSVRGKSCGSFGISGGDELCTCISVLDTFVTSTTLSPIKLGLSIASSADVVLSLTDKINTGSHKSTCSHPDNSTPACTSSNICGFTCKAGFTKSGNSCVAIPPPTTVDVSVSTTVCACISGTITLGSTDCGSISTSDALCTCTSVLADVIVKTSLSPIKKALTIGSSLDVVASLTAKINSSPRSTCSHPDNSTPSCTQSNLCAFTCNNGFKLGGGKCVKQGLLSGLLSSIFHF
ncbi:hypothetical protein FB45DRAFT_448352 [Roridomyces roridus]|uniref:Uncharacterized protein n=1 Tax=Roridomyces roridus TaxID=1738132 RepID=A0AAD7FPU8_9AGAR|nr:hypothetical protein FB45DRAFT_448352 [Roridomyces roridus]